MKAKNTPKRRFKYQIQLTKSDPTTILTIPDDAYTIRDMLVKYSNGVPPSITKTPVFNNGDLDSDDLEKVKASGFDHIDAYKRTTEKRLQRLKLEHERLHQQLQNQTEPTNDDDEQNDDDD